MFWDRASGAALLNSFYYFVLHYWTLLGDSEAWMRGLSAVAAIGSVPLMYLVGSRLFGRVQGLVGAALLGSNAFFVRYGQEARAYMLAMFLSLAATLLFLKLMDGAHPGLWAPYGLLICFAVLAHTFAIFVFMAHAASIVLLRVKISRRMVVAGAIALILLLPVLIESVRQVFERERRLIHPVSLQSTADLWQDFTGHDYRWVVYALMAVIAAGAAVATWRRERLNGHGTSYLVLMAWFLFPIVGSIVVALIQPVFLPRYVIFALPPLMLLVAVGVCHLRPRWLVALGLVVLLVTAGRELYDWYTNTVKEDWRAATSYVLARSDANDGILFFHQGGYAPFLYYVEQTNNEELFPQLVATYNYEIYDPYATYDTIWVVVSHAVYTPENRAQTEAILDTIGADFALVGGRQFIGVDVRRYESSQ